MCLETKQNWKCSQCKSRQPKTDNTNTPVRSVLQSSVEEEMYQPTLESRVTMRRNRSAERYVTEDKLKEILRKELSGEIEGMLEATLTRMVSNQLKNICNRFTEFQESMSFISGQYEDLKSIWKTLHRICSA